jgi:hypothetical protein
MDSQERPRSCHGVVYRDLFDIGDRLQCGQASSPNVEIVGDQHTGVQLGNGNWRDRCLLRQRVDIQRPTGLVCDEDARIEQPTRRCGSGD